MATVIICDGGCGAQSPDPATRLHIANHWLRVRTRTNRDWDQASGCDDLLFCKSCASRVEAALKATAMTHRDEINAVDDNAAYASELISALKSTAAKEGGES